MKPFKNIPWAVSQSIQLETLKEGQFIQMNDVWKQDSMTDKTKSHSIEQLME